MDRRPVLVIPLVSSHSFLILIYIYLLYLFLLRQKGPAYMETDVGLQIKLGICLLEKHKWDRRKQWESQN